MSFPRDFLFGASSAAYQIEGGWDADGKGENIWDRLVHTRPEMVKNKENGDTACDSYNLFEQDIAALKEIGFQVYRFSISWARILPTGDITHVNTAGVNYYHSLIDKLLENGIQPMVTMYHWDLPQRLQDIGGWMNPLIADYMEDYAHVLFQLYGEKVKLWITINEPEMITVGYADSTRPSSYAPALSLDSPANYIVAYNILRAHARVYRLYDTKFRLTQEGKVAISLDTNCYKEKSTSNEDVQATTRAWAFRFELFANPIFGEKGDFPELVKKIVAENSEKEGRRRSRLPEFSEEEKQSLIGSSDFFGLNHYMTWLCTHDPEKSTTSLVLKDTCVKFEKDPRWRVNYAKWPVVPWGLREVLRFIKDKYKNPPVFITENDYGGQIGVLEDKERIDYHRDYLQEVVNAREDFGCNVIGYAVWSLTDNFQWNDGYDFCFGIVSVDFHDPSRKRTQKSSAKFFKNLLETRSIPP